MALLYALRMAFSIAFYSISCLSVLILAEPILSFWSANLTLPCMGLSESWSSPIISSFNSSILFLEKLSSFKSMLRYAII